jgi:hypothetical protein
MKFYARSKEEPIHVALVTGHTAVITVEGTELDKMFHQEAMQRGAMLEGGVGSDDITVQARNRAITIKDALQAMRDGAAPADFTTAGKPDLRKLIAKLGFQVTRDEVDAYWEELSEDA